MLTCKTVLADNVEMKFCGKPAEFTDAKTQMPVCKYHSRTAVSSAQKPMTITELRESIKATSELISKPKVAPMWKVPLEHSLKELEGRLELQRMFELKE